MRFWEGTASLEISPHKMAHLLFCLVDIDNEPFTFLKMEPIGLGTPLEFLEHSLHFVESINSEPENSTSRRESVVPDELKQIYKAFYKLYNQNETEKLVKEKVIWKMVKQLQDAKVINEDLYGTYLNQFENTAKKLNLNYLRNRTGSECILQYDSPLTFDYNYNHQIKQAVNHPFVPRFNKLIRANPAKTVRNQSCDLFSEEIYSNRYSHPNNPQQSRANYYAFVIKKLKALSRLPNFNFKKHVKVMSNKNQIDSITVSLLDSNQAFSIKYSAEEHIANYSFKPVEDKVTNQNIVIKACEAAVAVAKDNMNFNLANSPKEYKGLIKATLEKAALKFGKKVNIINFTIPSITLK